MGYLKTNWQDEVTPLSAANLNKMEAGIANAGVTGQVIQFAGETAPAGYLSCNGATVSRATYADLFAVIGTKYGVGNGTTTFSLPSMSGKFVRGGSGAGVGVVEEATKLDTNNVYGYPYGYTSSGGRNQEINLDADGGYRPDNIALMFCIKY